MKAQISSIRIDLGRIWLEPQFCLFYSNEKTVNNSKNTYEREKRTSKTYEENSCIERELKSKKNSEKKIKEM